MAYVDFSLSVAKKSKTSINFSMCVICQERNPEHLKKLTKVSKASFFEALEVRRDDLFQKFVNEFQSTERVPRDSLEISCHKSCYKSYTSKHNLRAFSERAIEPNQRLLNDAYSCVPASFTRTQTQMFDWEVCFVCGKESYKKNRRLHSMESKVRLESVKAAANTMNDIHMLCILQDENVLTKSLYHNACLTKYISKSKTMSSLCVQSDDIDEAYDSAFSKLISDVDDVLFVKKQATQMTSLHESFLSYLPENVPKTFSRKRLRRWLEQHYGDKIKIQTGQKGHGQSSVVIRGSINVCDAVGTALSGFDKDISMSDLSTVTIKETGMTDSQILHRAASILRKEINDVDIDLTKYPTASKVSLDHSLTFVPNNLNQFIMWLIDEKSHKNIQTTALSGNMRKSLAIAECLISVSRDTFTPFYLAMALHIYHEFGSKQLIDLLNCHGFCASYTEVRRFLTSVADTEIERHSGCESYVPVSILPVSKGGQLLQEGADNIDINTETVDGKNTFHSMARAIFQERVINTTVPADNFEVDVLRGKNRSLRDDQEVHSVLQCLPFQKPQRKPEPAKHHEAVHAFVSGSVSSQCEKDKVWAILRASNRDVIPRFITVGKSYAQTIPLWTGFNVSISEAQERCHSVTYVPVIDAKPSDMATVYTAMRRCSDMSQDAGQSFSVQTFDQQLYAIAQQVKWANPEVFKTHILRLGGFHMLSCFIAALGKLWGDGGLRDLLIDSGVYAGNTVDHMLNGKEFNRAVRALILVFDALTSLQISAFFRWCEDTGRITTVPADIWEVFRKCKESYEDSVNRAEVVSELEKLYCTHLHPLMEEFRNLGRHLSPTFQYWDMLLQAIHVMLSFIRAERDGIWLLHLKAVSEMIPYFFATNRTNYSRWVPIYLQDMLSLPDEVKTAFMTGSFAIRQVPGTFNGIWSDMATEKTIIKDLKGNGGIVGLTQQKSTLVRWAITRHALASISRSLKYRSSTGESSTQSSHPESNPFSMTRDEEHVQQLITHLKHTMTDPFAVENHPPCLLNISSGMLASNEVQNALLSAVNKGYSMFEKFMEKSLKEDAKESFYQSIPKSKLKTFADMSCKIKVCHEKNVSVMGYINPEILFRRALLLSNLRPDVSLETILSHPVGPIPVSLFYEDGTLRKTNKSELASQLQAGAECLDSLATFEGPTSLIRDAMEVVQRMDVKKFKTFGDFATGYARSLLSCFHRAGQVTDVFDRYDKEFSIKGTERKLRAERSHCTKVFQVLEPRALPDWKKFLAVDENKSSLVSFLGKFVQKMVSATEELSHGKSLYIAGGFDNPDVVKKFTCNAITECEDLASSQEEADARMIVHVVFADSLFRTSEERGRIVVQSSDTDVIVLCCHYFSKLLNTQELWIQRGHQHSLRGGRQFVPVHEICSALSVVAIEVLPIVHALTGCDTVSSFYGIGKKSVFKLIKQDSEVLQQMRNVDDINAFLCACRNFVARLYDSKSKYRECHGDLNKLRCKLAITKEACLARLPPSEIAFREHVERTRIQSLIWLNAHNPRPPNMLPTDHGWFIKDGALRPVPFRGSMSADILRDLVCVCKGKMKCSKECTCSVRQFPCTELCLCGGGDTCSNGITHHLFFQGQVEQVDEQVDFAGEQVDF